MTEIVKKYHNGRMKGPDGSYVTEDIAKLISLYILSEGTIVHSEALPAKRNIVKNALKKLAMLEQQTGIDRFDEKQVQRAVAEECVRTDRIDPRTIQNYTSLTMQLLDPCSEDMCMFELPGVHKTVFL